ELDKDKTYIALCSVGLRGYIAERALKDKGYKALNLAGGFTTYKNMYRQSDKAAPQEPKSFSDSGVSNVTVGKVVTPAGETVKLNACGLSCPGPIIQVADKMKGLKDGDVLEVSATD